MSNSSDKPQKFDNETFNRIVLERAKTYAADGKTVTSEVQPHKLMFDHVYTDVDGGRWEVQKPSPYSEGRDTLLYIFVDETELRAYCVPTPQHPGMLTRYIVPREKPSGAKYADCRIQKTASLDVFAALIAYELRELDNQTPPVTHDDERRETQGSN